MNKKLYEVVAEAEADRIGAWAMAEHKEYWQMELGDADYRDNDLGGGWRWIRASATRDGPKGTAVIGGVGLLIGPKFNSAFLNCKVHSQRVMTFTFKGRQQRKINIIVVYSPPAVHKNH